MAIDLAGDDRFDVTVADIDEILSERKIHVVCRVCRRSRGRSLQGDALASQVYGADGHRLGPGSSWRVLALLYFRRL